VIAGILLTAAACPAQPVPAPGPPEAPAQRGRTAAAYILGPGDEVIVRALHVPEMDGHPLRIDATGGIDLPITGRVEAGGLTAGQLRQRIARLLEPYIRDPQVRIEIAAFRSQAVSVLGAVRNPGVIYLQGPTSLTTVLSLAGGSAPEAGDSVQVRRDAPCLTPLPGAETQPGGGALASYRVSRLAGAAQTEPVLVCSGDVISMPRARVVYVTGEVRKPGGFMLHDDETISVLQALALAEGPLRTAGTRHARLLRPAPGRTDRVEREIDLAGMLSGKAPDVRLQADDILFVPNNAAKSATLRAVEAAVQMGTGVVIWRR
jgi:polysaccharide export outer membrane protein